MIFVTVGSQKFPFDRLIRKMDHMIQEGLIKDEVFIQTGVSEYIPVCCYQKFCEREHFDELMETCSILITHGGAGTIVEALKRKKKVIVVPRLAKYGEHVDDHQMELAMRFHEMNLLYACFDVEQLPNVLQNIGAQSFDTFCSNNEMFLKSLDCYINSLCQQKNHLKILEIGPSEIRARGGMSEVIRDIRESEVLSRDFEIDSFPSYIDGSLIVRLLYSILGYFRFLMCYRKYELFHIHTAERGSTFRKSLYLQTIKRAKKKAVVHIHGAEYLTFYDRLDGWKKRSVDKFFRKADLVLALSDVWKHELESRFQMNACEILYNGVVVENIKSAISDPKEHQNEFIMLGRLGERKGTYDLIAAAEIAVGRNPKLIIYLAGDGDVEKVRTLVKEKGLERNVIVLGWIDGAEKLHYLHNAATVVLPSHHEGLPMAILEGMAAGKAIISTKVGAIPEVVGAENGILIEPGNISELAKALLWYGSNTEELVRASENNMKKIKDNFSICQTHETLSKYYKQIIK